jgi:Protein of unknown function (DUF1598).
MINVTRLIAALVCLAFTLLQDSPLHAQFGIPGFGGGFGNNQNGGNQFDNGLGGVGGVLIDAEGIVRLRTDRPVSSAALKKQLSRFAQEALPANIVTESPARVVSLRQLEALLAKSVEENTNLPLEARYLAGLQRIDTIVFDSENRDVYLVGPAEAFGPDAQGRMLGVNSGRPTLMLEDLIVALRASGLESGTIGCSIDPTPENMQRLQEFLRQNSTPAVAGQVQQRFRMMANVLGNQVITVWGVPENSHFALAIVEADLRMKRISLGLDPAGVPGIRSHLSLLRPQGNSLQRWWFVPMYDPLETNPQRTVFHLKGQRVKLLAQEEISDASGRRSDAAMTRQSTEKFAQLFTKHFQELADRSPPFAELQNLYDLAVVATLIRIEGPRHLGDNSFPVMMASSEVALPHYPAPKSVPSSSTFRSAGAGTMLGLVGGVTIDISPVVQATQVTLQETSANFRDVVKNQALFGDSAGK